MIAHALNLLLGAWLLFAPGILGYEDPTAVRNSVWMGTAVVSFSALSLASLFRARSGNTAIGVWLICAPWVIGYGYAGDFKATVNELLSGALILAVSLLETRADERRADRRLTA